MSKNSYQKNELTGAIPSPAMPTPNTYDERFISWLNRTIAEATEALRELIPCHQAAIAIIIDQDWQYVRKYFSLSEKYADWKNYDAPAQGKGTHAWMLQQKIVVRYTQEELEAHPHWQGFGREANTHPPMNGWLAAPILTAMVKNWGLIQLSDKTEGEFDEADEVKFTLYADLLSKAIEARWQVRNLEQQFFN